MFVLKYFESNLQCITHWRESYFCKQFYKESAKTQSFSTLFTLASGSLGHLNLALSSCCNTSPAAQREHFCMLPFRHCCKTMLWLFLISAKETSCLYNKTFWLWFSWFQPVSLTLQWDFLVLHARLDLGHKLSLLNNYNLNFLFNILLVLSLSMIFILPY